MRRLRQRYRETGRTADSPCSGRPRVTTPAQDRYIRTSHLRDRYRMATTTTPVTPGTHNHSISAQTVRNKMREAVLIAYWHVVRQVLIRHHRQQRRLWAQTHCHWTRQHWQNVNVKQRRERKAGNVKQTKLFLGGTTNKKLWTGKKCQCGWRLKDKNKHN